MTSSAREPEARLRRNSALSMAGLIVLGATRVVYGSLVSRAAGPESFGLVSVFLGVTLILSLFLPGGLGSAVSHFVPYARGSGDVRAANALYARLRRYSGVTAIVLGCGAAAVLAFLGRQPHEVAEVGLLTAAYAIYTTQKPALYAFDRVGTYLRLEVLASVASLAGTVVVLASGSNLYLTPLVLGYTLFIGAAWWTLAASTRDTATSVSRTGTRTILSYASLASIGSLASAGFLQLTQLLAAQHGSLTSAAYFGASITLIAPLAFLPRALSLAMFPVMAEAHGSGQVDAVRRDANLTTRVLLAVLAPLFVAAEFLAPVLLQLFGGDAFVPGALILQIMLLAAFVGVTQVPSVNALSSESGEGLRTPVAWAVTGAATGLGLMALAWDRLDATSVAVAYLIGTTVTAAGPIVTVWRRYAMDWAGPLARALTAVVAALVAARLLDAAPGGGSWIGAALGATAGLAASALLLGRDLRDVVRTAGTLPSAAGAGIRVPDLVALVIGGRRGS